jgi:beta-1,4-mannosyltransferase
MARGRAPHVWVVVLGDLGRSPRMQFHALSLLAAARARVTLLGYAGAELLPALAPHAAAGALAVRHLPPPPAWLARLPRPAALALKAALQLLALLWAMLVAMPRPDAILLQLPPALPTMAACWAAARLRRARLVFDWHNFAYTLMALGEGGGANAGAGASGGGRRGAPSPPPPRRSALVLAAERYERAWAPRADAALCVTAAMAVELAAGWRVRATPFHDRPPASARRATLAEAHALFGRLQEAFLEPMHPRDWAAAAAAALPAGATLATAAGAARGAAPRARPGRPAVVVSSTSWTPDEDFAPLLDAARRYDAAARGPAGAALPDLLILVTGRGPLRAACEAAMRALDLRRVALRTLWLAPGDYPTLLGAADLGVCLHASSSGLDLPMKVVDMFGAGLPVVAVGYPVLAELLRDGENGVTFAGGVELAAQLQRLLGGFPWGGESGGEEVELTRLARGAAATFEERWDAAWRRIAMPVVLPGHRPPR